MTLRKNLILRRPQSGRLEGRMRIIQLENGDTTNAPDA